MSDKIGTVLKSLLKRTARRMGVDLRRYRPATSQSAQFMTMLAEHKVNLVFDVGANIGQFGRSLRDGGYTGRIVSFEPLSREREQLLKASRRDPLWEIAPRAAIGGEDGEIEVHVAGNSASSSVLEMLDAHTRAAPDSRYVGNETVPLRRLDSIAFNYFRKESVAFLKVDTQGYESQVLQGATILTDQLVGLQLELSFIPLYRGQQLFDELVKQLEALGFELWAMTPAFIDPQCGRLLQVDATFFKSARASGSAK